MSAITERIYSALVASLMENDFREISVSELCERAQVSRNAFYSSYSDMYALAASFAHQVEKELMMQPHTADDFSWLFAYIAEHKAIFTAYFKLPYLTQEADYTVAFFRKGTYSVAKLWFQEGCQESPEQMGNIIKREYDKRFQQ